MVNMDFHRVTADLVFPAVELFLNKRTRQHTTFVAKKQLQHSHFTRGQRHGFSVERHTAGCGIKFHCAMGYLRRYHAVATADQRLQPCCDFHPREWLTQIIIGTGLQPADALLQRIARGEDKHWRIPASLSPFTQKLHTIHTRQA
ncbi:hypothetical protein SRABI106_02917 [Rahnella aquatilis]|nr:hypothetical protein SRABI106_02917 [Rahnella aquatilis]